MTPKPIQQSIESSFVSFLQNLFTVDNPPFGIKIQRCKYKQLVNKYENEKNYLITKVIRVLISQF